MKPEDQNIPTPTDTQEITVDDLKSICIEAVKDSTADQIQSLKNEIKEAGQKSVFPTSSLGDSHLQSIGDSVVDTSYFHKSYRYQAQAGIKANSILMAKQLLNSGGPWLRLSKNVEDFIRIMKCKFQPHLLQQEGIDMKEYNERCLDEYKAAGMSEGIAADGGVLVPVEYAATVIEFATMQSPILSRVWQLPMSSNVLKIPRLVQAAGSYFGGLALYWADEAEQKTKTKPQFQQLTFTAKKLIGLCYLTDELIADSMINITNYITGLFTRAFQWEMERVIIAGTGTGQPLGIVNDPSVNIVARNTAGTISYQDVPALDNALDENFQDLTWITRKTTQNTLMTLRDSNNRPIFFADYAVFAGQPMHPPSMTSYPVLRTRNVPALGSQGDLILGDLSMYLWTPRQSLTIDTSMHSRFEYDETGIRFVSRQDGKPAVSIAFAILNDATS